MSGIIAATAAFTVGEFTHLIGVDSLPGRFGVFVLVYIVVAIIADRAMRHYGTGKK
jgi:hypothetical protein